MFMASALNVVDMTLMPAMPGHDHVEGLLVAGEDRAEQRTGRAAAGRSRRTPPSGCARTSGAPGGTGARRARRPQPCVRPPRAPRRSARGRRPRARAGSRRGRAAASPRASAALVSWCSSAVGSSISRVVQLAVLVAPGHAVARRRRAELAGRALGHDPPLLDDRHAVAQRLRLVEVVRRQQDRLAEVLQRADRPPTRRGAPRGRSPSSARRGRSARGRRRARARGPAGAAGRRRACARTRPPSPRRPAMRDDLVDVARVRVEARPSARSASRGVMWRYMPVDCRTMPDPLAQRRASAAADRGRARTRSPPVRAR